MESKSKKSNLPLIRRCLAIGLVLLSIMFLFWPTTVAVSSRLRSSRIDDRAVQYINRYDCSESQAKTIAELELVDSFRGASILDLRGRLTYYALRQSIEDANKKETHGEDWFDDYLDRLSDDLKTERTLNILGGVCVNVFFFCMLAAGVAAIVLYALNKTRIAGIVFAVLAVLLVAVAVGYMIYTNVSSNEALDARNVPDEVWDVQHDPVAPGVSMFLIPIFAIASCIVYQRTGRKKARAQKPAAVPVEPFANTPRVPRDPFEAAQRQPYDPFTEAVRPSENPFEPAQRPSYDPFAETVRPADNSFAPAQRQSYDPFAETVRPAENPFAPAQRPIRRPAPVETPENEPSAEAVHSAENPSEPAQSQQRDPFAETVRSTENPFETAQCQQRDPFAETVRSTENPFETAQRQQRDPFAETMRSSANPFETVQRQTARPAPVEQPAGNPFTDAPRPEPRPAPVEQPAGNPFADAPRPEPRPAPVEQPAGNPFTNAPRPEPAANSGWTCPLCQQTNPESARFCTGCGTQKPSVKRSPICRSCGMELKPGARFCPYCGERQA